MKLRVALANLPAPRSLEDAVTRAEAAIRIAGARRAAVLCFPECYVPGYRTVPNGPPSLTADDLEQAWCRIAACARDTQVGVILGTERHLAGRLHATALVIDQDGTRLGFQDKVQLDPSEDATYSPGTGRHLFRIANLTFGIAICHEAWRYPETVRWAAQRGAQVVFHPHFHDTVATGGQQPVFAHPSKPFHEMAMICRAAENTCFFVSVNCATPGSLTTFAVISPDGTLLTNQPYGEEGILIADLNLDEATGLLAGRHKPIT